ncbi:MAG: hypothetical protein HY545_00265 [Candidatus Doudnabacteria bacterium]|nr:hypothetical protein [Candidatus Doudnabacteria bacterium]
MRGYNDGDIERQRQINIENARRRKEEILQKAQARRPVAKNAAERIVAFDDTQIEKFITDALTDLNFHFPKGKGERNSGDEAVEGTFLLKRLEASDWFVICRTLFWAMDEMAPMGLPFLWLLWLNSERWEKEETAADCVRRIFDVTREFALQVLKNSE